MRNIIGADSKGALHVQREDYLDGSMNAAKRWFAEATNPDCRAGSPGEVIDGEDLLIGLSGARTMPAEALARMADDAMVFAMANPNPEVSPEEAEPYVRIIATGRSDYPNQINNVLCFPGVFRGALDVRAPAITEPMKMAAAHAIAATVAEERTARGLHHPVGLQPRRRAGRRRGGRRRGARGGHGARRLEVGFAQGDTMTPSSPQRSPIAPARAQRV